MARASTAPENSSPASAVDKNHSSSHATPKSPPKSGLLLVLTALLGASVLALLVQGKALARVRGENQELQRRARNLAQLEADNKLLLSQLAEAGKNILMDNGRFRELLRLRGQSSEPTTLSPTPPATSKEEAGPRSKVNDSAPASAVPATDPSKVIPSEFWAYSGYATPEAALQTVAWAMNRGNLEAFLACVLPSARQAAEAQFADKSEEESAAMLRAQIAPARALRLDRKQILEDGQVAFTLYSIEQDDGSTVSRDGLVVTFRNLDGEWRLVPAASD